MNKVKYFMKKLHYSDEEIEMVLNNKVLENMKEETVIRNIYDIFTYLLSLNFKLDELIYMSKKWGGLFTTTINNLIVKIDYFRSLGYDDKKIKKIIIKFPAIIGMSIENIERKINELYSLGFTRENVLSVFLGNPQIVSLKIENIIEKIEILNSYNYSLEDIINIITLYPTILNFNNETLINKLNFYTSIDINSYLAMYPKDFMQSVELTYARYMFLKDRDLEILPKYLFLASVTFKNKYGITNDAVVNMYPYSMPIKRERD